MKPGAPSLQPTRSLYRFAHRYEASHYNLKFVTISVIEFSFSAMERRTTQPHGQRLPTLPLKA